MLNQRTRLEHMPNYSTIRPRVAMRKTVTKRPAPAGMAASMGRAAGIGASMMKPVDPDALAGALKRRFRK